MTPNIASVISSASNANGSASAFLFAAASEPEAAFSVPFPEAYARRTTTERQSQTIHIDPRPRALLSPPTLPRIPRLATRVSSHSNAPRPARARARSRRFLTFVVFLPRAAAHTPTRHDHTSSVSARIPRPLPPRARVSHHPSPTTASSHRVRGRVPARIARHRPRASVPRPRGRAVTSRERSHAPSLELARGTDALRFVARVMIPRRVAPRRRRVRARRSPQPYPLPNPSACVVYRVPMKEAVLS